MRTNFSLKVYFKVTKLAQCVAEELLDAQSGEMVPLASPKISEVPHADGLTELRLMTLKANKCASWKTDRVLVLDAAFPRERFYGHLPDAIWTSHSGRRIAVEYERTCKGVGRVRKKVEAFGREMARSDRVIDLVLWVAEPGAYQDLEGIPKAHPAHRLRTTDYFMAEIQKSGSSESKDTHVAADVEEAEHEK